MRQQTLSPAEAELTQQQIAALVATAIDGLSRSYAPYSHFHVSAALLAEDGTIFSGCNIENAAYSVSNCAERTAFFTAVHSGARSFRAIAIVGGTYGQVHTYCPPCGVCRQVMREFCDPHTFVIILADSLTHWVTYRLEELLPLSFGPANLDER